MIRPSSLRAVPLFSRLGDAELATLAAKFTESRHQAGAVIHEEGPRAAASRSWPTARSS